MRSDWLKFKKGEIEAPVIKDPKDWFEKYLIVHRDETIELYNGLTDEQKQLILNCFDDGIANVFDKIGAANGWMGECDDDDFAAAKDKVEKIIASFP